MVGATVGPALNEADRHWQQGLSQELLCGQGDKCPCEPMLLGVTADKGIFTSSSPAVSPIHPCEQPSA